MTWSKICFSSLENALDLFTHKKPDKRFHTKISGGAAKDRTILRTTETAQFQRTQQNVQSLWLWCFHSLLYCVVKWNLKWPADLEEWLSLPFNLDTFSRADIGIKINMVSQPMSGIITAKPILLLFGWRVFRRPSPHSTRPVFIQVWGSAQAGHSSPLQASISSSIFAINPYISHWIWHWIAESNSRCAVGKQNIYQQNCTKRHNKINDSNVT